MSHGGIEAMTLAGNDILSLADGLSPTEWQSPSAAHGWSIHDVVTHLGELTAMLLAAVQGTLSEPDPPIGVEKLNDHLVDQRATWTPQESVDSFRTLLQAALPTFGSMQDPPLATTEAPLLDLGTYPLHAIADMFAFDYTTHLRWDILSPRGPVHRDLPPLDAARLTPAVSWLLGGIPQMQPDLVDNLAAPIQLTLTGPAERTVTLRPANGPARIVVDHGPNASASVELISNTSDFLAWATQRIPWQNVVTVDGDATVAKEFLNALNLI